MTLRAFPRIEASYLAKLNLQFYRFICHIQFEFERGLKEEWRMEDIHQFTVAAGEAEYRVSISAPLLLQTN